MSVGKYTTETEANQRLYASKVQSFWHKKGCKGVRVWAVEKDAVLWNGKTVRSMEIVSNLVNGLPPR